MDYLLKPAAVDKLCERIQAALERKKVLEELEGGGAQPAARGEGTGGRNRDF